MMQTQNECLYMKEGAAMPFCKGCGHSNILRKLDEAFTRLQLNPEDVCLVTDIGCIGLADALFDKIHTVHTTHGRSTAFATGIAVADKILAEKKLKTVVLIGDGGSMIGLLHIVNAALLNTDVTVLVANNFLFGMTGGQQSSLTPLEFITQTTPYGNIIPPLDICSIAVSSKADFVYRTVATDKNLTGIIADAIQHDGFSLVEILELCPEHAVAKNNLKGTDLVRLAEEHGHKLGEIKNDNGRKEFGKRYEEKYEGVKGKEDRFITPDNNFLLTKPLGIFIAGSAGEKVQSSAAMLCSAAVNSGLYATQKNDNPVTQGSGFSMSEIILSPEEINYFGIETPAVLIIASNDGLKELQVQGILQRTDGNTLILADEKIAEFDAQGIIKRLPFRKTFGAGKAAIGAIDYLVRTENPFPHGYLQKLISAKYGELENTLAV